MAYFGDLFNIWQYVCNTMKKVLLLFEIHEVNQNQVANISWLCCWLYFYWFHL